MAWFHGSTTMSVFVPAPARPLIVFPLPFTAHTGFEKGSGGHHEKSDGVCEGGKEGAGLVVILDSQWGLVGMYSTVDDELSCIQAFDRFMYAY